MLDSNNVYMTPNESPDTTSVLFEDSALFRKRTKKNMMESDKRSTLPRGDFNLQASDVEACRICLSTDNKLYSLKDTNLRSCLESIGGFRKSCEGLPNYVCYECAPTLIKCNKLIEKSQKARATLEDIFEKNGQITKPLIKSQNRTQLNLRSSLDSYLLLNYYYIKYDDDNNKSEFIKTESNPNIKIETKKEDEEIGVETKMEDALAETVKESLYLRKIKEENSEIPMLDDSVEEIKKDVSVVELSDDDEAKDVGRSNREEIEKRNKRMMVQEIFNKLKPFKRPKRASRGQQSETNSEQESVPMSQMEYHEIKEYFKIVGKKTEVLLDVIDKTQKQTGIGFTCNVCFKSFGNAALLQEHAYHHVSSSHGKVECPVCLLCFSDNAEMEVHKKRVHAREYRCKFCPAVFEDLEEAKAHKNSLCNATDPFPANNPLLVTDPESVKNSGPSAQEAQTDRLSSSMETSSSPEPAKQRSWYPKNWLNE